MSNSPSTAEYLETLNGPKIREFEWNGKTFYVASTECNEVDARRLMTGIIHQSVKDFERLANPPTRNDKNNRENWSTARGLLFDDDYFIDFGHLPLNLKEMFEYISKDKVFSITSMRRSLIAQTRTYWQNKGVELEEEFWKQE